MMAGVSLRGVTKRYVNGAQSGNWPAVADVNLEVADGECLALVGGSGCGKTTLLRLIAGLEIPSSGEVWVGGRRVDDLPPHRREVSLAFQQPALYPHWKVRRNIAAGGTESPRLTEVVECLELADLLDRMPSELSGGEQQRVALARVVARRSAVTLLDEPLSSLDASLRGALRQVLLRLLRQRDGEALNSNTVSSSTVIWVTHDLVEAMAVADRIAVLGGGRLLQVGSPAEVYERPASVGVAALWGADDMNLLPGRLVSNGTVGEVERFVAAGWSVNLASSLLGVQEAGQKTVAESRSKVTLAVRPQALCLTLGPDRLPVAAGVTAGDWATLEPSERAACVRRVECRGEVTRCEVDVGTRLMVAVDSRLDWQVGQTVTVWMDRQRVSRFFESKDAES